VNKDCCVPVLITKIYRSRADDKRLTRLDVLIKFADGICVISKQSQCQHFQQFTIGTEQLPLHFVSCASIEAVLAVLVEQRVCFFRFPNNAHARYDSIHLCVLSKCTNSAVLDSLFNFFCR
jgi:hypothetical protein